LLKELNVASNYDIDVLLKKVNNILPFKDLEFRFPMDENTGTLTKDYSGNDRHATLHSATWTSGKFSYATAYSGSSQYVKTNNTLQMSGTVLTLNIWLYPTYSDSNYQTVISDAGQYVGYLGYIWCYRPISSNSLIFEYSDSSTQQSVGVYDIFNGYDGQFVMITIVADYTNKTVKFYRNGVQYGET